MSPTVTWLACSCFLASAQALNFFVAAYRRNVFAIFGRKGMSGSSLVYLSLMASMPLVTALATINGPDTTDFFEPDPEWYLAQAMAVFISAHLFMGWCSQGVRADTAVARAE